MHRPHAIVVGAGIAGLAAAIALRRAGYTVAIADCAARLTPQGTALSLWSNAMAALERRDVAAPIVRDAAPIRTLRLLTHSGGTLLPPVEVPPAYLPTRALLQTALLAPLSDTPLHLARAARSITQRNDRSTVTFDDDTAEEADLTIVANGIWSASATALLANPPTYRGYHGVLAISDAGATPPAGVAAEYWGADDRFGVFDAGGTRSYWFYMRGGYAPGTSNLGAITHDGLTALAARWPAAVRAAVAATPADRLTPVAIHARAVPARLGRGRILCVGDAAHAMEPNLGQGAAQALEDAVVLGVAAAELPPDRLVDRFETMRLVRLRRLMLDAAQGGRATHGRRWQRWLLRAPMRLAPHPLVAAAIHRTQRLPSY